MQEAQNRIQAGLKQSLKIAHIPRSARKTIIFPQTVQPRRNNQQHQPGFSR